MRAPERLFGLDAMRGFAALSVVVFHWQFWGVDVNRTAPAGGFPLPRAIGEAFLAFFYQCGMSAVGLFFTLSGFVFYWLYRNAIEARRVGGRWFFVDRFSRLYPLYFVTLLWAWGGHNLYAWMNQGPNWSSGVNDFTGFLRQVFVFPLWTPHRVIGFNLPAWSLAVEALLYTLFYFLARRATARLVTTLAMLLVAVVAGRYSSDISYGMTSFFMGGLCYVVFELVEGAWLERTLRVIVGLSWLLAIVFGCGLVRLALTPLAFLDHFYAMYVLFPATVLYLALLETRRGPVGRGLTWLGDSTYAIYLIHFPLMLTTAIAWHSVGGDFQRLRSPFVLATFIVVVVLLALASHRFFERPVQAWIRRRSSLQGAGAAAARGVAAVQPESAPGG